MQKKYDIIVAGCGCAGFAAAVQAGRLGKNVLIIEKNGMPGGIMTVGGNNDVAQFYAHQNQIIAGIGWEFVNLLKEEGGAVIPDMHKTGVPHWYYGVHVNIPLAAAKMDEMLLDARVDICYEQFICAANVESDRDGKKISSSRDLSKSEPTFSSTAPETAIFRFSRARITNAANRPEKVFRFSPEQSERILEAAYPIIPSKTSMPR